MQLRDHEQVSLAWTSRRGQRCLSFALLFVLILVISLFGLPSFSFASKKAMTELQFDTLHYNGFSHYTSTPEAGAPNLPFRDNAKRRANPAPWFGQDWEDEQQDVVIDMPLVQQRHDEIHEQVLTRDELEKLERGEGVVGVTLMR